MSTFGNFAKKHKPLVTTVLGLVMASMIGGGTAKNANASTVTPEMFNAVVASGKILNPNAPDFDPNRNELGDNCYEHAVEGTDNSNDPLLSNVGHSVGRDYSGLDPETWIALAVEDGLESAGNEILPNSKQKHYLAALYIHEPDENGKGGDYHWIRENSDGKWSQKFGASNVGLVLDDNKNPVSEPPEELFGYKRVQYFYVPSKGIETGFDAFVEKQLKYGGISAICEIKPELEELISQAEGAYKRTGLERFQNYNKKFEASLSPDVFHAWKQCDIEATNSMMNQVSEQMQSRM